MKRSVRSALKGEQSDIQDSEDPISYFGLTILRWIQSQVFSHLGALLCSFSHAVYKCTQPMKCPRSEVDGSILDVNN
jgi:hypothetical protein